jgi:cyclase
MHDVVARTADQVFIPLTVGGGVRSADDVDRLLRAGADKVSLNTAAIARPGLLTEVAARFGSQCVVISVDARRAEGQAGGFEVTTHGGRRGTGLDALEWAARAAELGAGEILLNSMDADGTKEGFDLTLIKAVRAVDVPVTSGGAGRVADFVPGCRQAPTPGSPRACSTSSCRSAGQGITAARAPGSPLPPAES